MENWRNLTVDKRVRGGRSLFAPWLQGADVLWCWGNPDGHSGFSLGCYAAPVDPSALEGSAPQHPIGLIKADEELLLLLLWQKTGFCGIDVLQDTKKDAQVPFGN